MVTCILPSDPSGVSYEYNPPEGDFGRSFSTLNSRGSSNQLPTIISRGETIRAAIGERVALPCQVKNLGECGRKFGGQDPWREIQKCVIEGTIFFMF